MDNITEEQAALAFAEATGCGYGSTGPDGKWRRILCDNEELHPTMERMNCDCRKGAKAILELIASGQSTSEKP